MTMKLVGLDPWDPVAFLKAQDTRFLLKLRNLLLSGYGDKVDATGRREHIVTRDQLYGELNTREHIPSKKEAKALRRIMSQTGLTADEVRANPKHAHALAGMQAKRLVPLDVLRRYSFAAKEYTRKYLRAALEPDNK